MHCQNCKKPMDIKLFERIFKIASLVGNINVSVVLPTTVRGTDVQSCVLFTVQRITV